MFAQYTHQPPLITGLVGTVEGIAEAGEDMLSMKFPILMNAVLDIKLEHLSREKTSAGRHPMGGGRNRCLLRTHRRWTGRTALLYHGRGARRVT